jgi:nuclear receptor subfamily 1 group D protein 3
MDEQHVSSTEPTLEQTALESKQLAIYDIILNVSQAHLANCGVTDDKLKLLQRRHATLVRFSYFMKVFITCERSSFV